MNTIEQINEYLLQAEKFSNEFMPLQDALTPIKADLDKALNELREKSQNAEDLGDKVFYLNRYTDLVRKVEGLFEARSKRLQNTLQTLAKLVQADPSTKTQSANTEEESDIEDTAKQLNLTPEDCAAIFSILNKKNEE